MFWNLETTRERWWRSSARYRMSKIKHHQQLSWRKSLRPRLRCQARPQTLCLWKRQQKLLDRWKSSSTKKTKTHSLLIHWMSIAEIQQLDQLALITLTWSCKNTTTSSSAHLSSPTRTQQTGWIIDESNRERERKRRKSGSCDCQKLPKLR